MATIYTFIVIFIIYICNLLSILFDKISIILKLKEVVEFYNFSTHNERERTNAWLNEIKNQSHIEWVVVKSLRKRKERRREWKWRKMSEPIRTKRDFLISFLPSNPMPYFNDEESLERVHFATVDIIYKHECGKSSLTLTRTYTFFFLLLISLLTES